MTKEGPTSASLLYVSDIGAEDIDVFSYGKRVGQLSGFNEPNGLCSDSKGHVFITDTYNSRIVEYSHGGTTPIAVLNDPGNHPIGCASDPTTGDLAATNYSLFYTGSISIYKKARGHASSYTGLPTTYYCAYDDSGNLFIDGFGSEGSVVLGELKKGSTTVLTVPLNFQAGWPGGLEWDGKHLALGDQAANKFDKSQPYPNAIYRLAIESNGVANVIKTAPLANAVDVVQFSLQDKTVIGPDASGEDVGFWRYPHGGNPKKIINNFYEPVGATLSR